MVQNARDVPEIGLKKKRVGQVFVANYLLISFYFR